jgi:hypothetical protein
MDGALEVLHFCYRLKGFVASSVPILQQLRLSDMGAVDLAAAYCRLEVRG